MQRELATLADIAKTAKRSVLLTVDSMSCAEAYGCSLDTKEPDLVRTSLRPLCDRLRREAECAARGDGTQSLAIKKRLFPLSSQMRDAASRMPGGRGETTAGTPELSAEAEYSQDFKVILRALRDNDEDVFEMACDYVYRQLEALSAKIQTRVRSLFAELIARRSDLAQQQGDHKHIERLTRKLDVLAKLLRDLNLGCEVFWREVYSA